MALLTTTRAQSAPVTSANSSQTSSNACTWRRRHLMEKMSITLFKQVRPFGCYGGRDGQWDVLLTKLSVSVPPNVSTNVMKIGLCGLAVFKDPETAHNTTEVEITVGNGQCYASRRVGRGVRWVWTHPPPHGPKRSAWKDSKMNLRTPKMNLFF